MPNIVLTLQQKEQYEMDGFLIESKFFKPEQVALLYQLATEDTVMRSNAFDLNDQSGTSTNLPFGLRRAMILMGSWYEVKV